MSDFPLFSFTMATKEKIQLSVSATKEPYGLRMFISFLQWKRTSLNDYISATNEDC